ncbi:MAG: type II toxin-antitoxin system Phd/YefM family antitoxin [Candidatus Azobacteroides sp.]|nr:type II toxin-antitoxin system Phd/YefM family antitoxin [Candidatus Azobacteroides sp.]
MAVISSKEFKNNSSHYFDRVDQGEKIIIRRGKNKSYSINSIEKEEFTDIPEEYLCDPFDISPSGDMFWADKRNVESLKESIKQAEKELKEGKYTVIKNEEELTHFFDSL